MNNLYYLNAGETSSSFLATIVETDHNVAKLIRFNNKTYSVYAQASHLPAFNKNDEVLCQLTEKGAFILAKSAHPLEKPKVSFEQKDKETLVLNFGKANIIIQKNGCIDLINDKSTIKMDTNGNVQVEAKHIKQHSKDCIEINADRHVYLNTEI